jgi:cholesterol transport system auxiliary component
MLRPAPTQATLYYSLNDVQLSASAMPIVPIPLSTTAPTLIVNQPHAAAGFDSPRIIYLRQAHKLDYFAHNEWVDPPARMLGPLLVTAIERSAAFRAVVLTPAAASGELRLDTEILRLQHEFQAAPSQVRFTLRAYLVEEKTRRVLAWREFEALTPASSEDPYGGVMAANQAVQAVLKELSEFCAQALRNRTKASAPATAPSIP